MKELLETNIRDFFKDRILHGIGLIKKRFTTEGKKQHWYNFLWSLNLKTLSLFTVNIWECSVKSIDTIFDIIFIYCEPEKMKARCKTSRQSSACLIHLNTSDRNIEGKQNILGGVSRMYCKEIKDYDFKGLLANKRIAFKYMDMEMLKNYSQHLLDQN